MSGDDGRPDPQDAIERRLMPLVLADFEQLIRIFSDFEDIQRRRLAAIMRDEKTSDEDERACEELRREFAGLLEKIHLTEGCIERLAAETSRTAAQIVATLKKGEERALRTRRTGSIDIDCALEEAGRLFSMTRARIRQIETKLMKLKARSGHAEPALENPADETSREKEIAVLNESPLTGDVILRWRDSLLQGEMRLRDVIDLDATDGAYRQRGNGNGHDDEDSDD